MCKNDGLVMTIMIRSNYKSLAELIKRDESESNVVLARILKVLSSKFFMHSLMYI